MSDEGPDLHEGEEPSRKSGIGSMLDARKSGDVERLIEGLSDTDRQVRWSAARSLGLLRDRRGVKPLIRRLQAKDPGLRVLAIRALARIGDKRAIPELYAIAVGDEPYDVRFNAMLGLASLGDERAPSLLVSAMTDPHLNEAVRVPRSIASARVVRKLAARRLVELGAVEAIPMLRERRRQLRLRERVRVWRTIRRLNAAWEIRLGRWFVRAAWHGPGATARVLSLLVAAGFVWLGSSLAGSWRYVMFAIAIAAWALVWSPRRKSATSDDRSLT